MSDTEQDKEPIVSPEDPLTGVEPSSVEPFVDKSESEGEMEEVEDDDETVGNTTFETTYGTDDEDDEDQEPPKLKYSRLTQLPPNFFNKDPISCVNFHESYFIFATHSGIIYITDNEFKQIRTFKAHRASVLAIYTDGEFFATGSMDGTVVIGSIIDEKDILAYDFKRPIHAVILDKNYGKSRSFVSGGMSGKVIYSSKNWLGQRSDLVLDENNGPIVSITTIDDIIIWMNDKGISIYHIPARSVIKVIEKPEDSPRSDLYWSKVSFPETDRVLIGWGNYIWQLRIALKTNEDKADEQGSTNMSRILPSTASISFRAIQEKKVEIEHVFKLDSLIAGISSFKDDYYMVLSYEPPVDGQFNYPDLKLINSLTGEVDFEEEIGLKNIENLGLNDYHLGIHIGEKATRYFIVSAKDGVIAQEIQLQDRLDWYVEHDKYFEAWDISEHLLTPLQRLNIGTQHVDHLMKIDDWDGASSFLSRIMDIDYDKLPDIDTKSTILTMNTVSTQHYDDEFVINIVQLWETYSMIFIRTGNFKHLSNILPTNPKLSLPTSIYNQVLNLLLENDVEEFIKKVKSWSHELFDVKGVEDSIETYLADNSNDSLRRSLVDLYVETEPQRAVRHLMILKDYNLIQFLSSHHLLLNHIKDLPKMIQLRFEGNEFETLPLDDLRTRLVDIVDILVDKRHEITPTTIIDLMNNNKLKYLNYLYLERLNEVDDFITRDFGNNLIELYSQFNREKLLPYLMKNSNYNFDLAIELCETNELYEELVYLLGKIGENKKALLLIIDKLDNPEIAINFAKHQNDREAWNILLDYSTNKPKFIQALIEGADDQSNPFYDPISIIKRIPNDVKIEGLKNSVTKISENNELNLLLSQLILNIISNRSEVISKKFRQELLQGLEIDTTEEKFSQLINYFETILIYNNTTEEKQKYVLESKISPRKVLYTDLQDKLNHLNLLNELFADFAATEFATKKFT